MSTSIDPAYVKANFPTIRPDWLSRHVEEPIDPDLPIIDAHHHLWSLPDFVYMRPEFLADVATGHNVRSSVFVDCKSHYRVDGPEVLRPVGETAFVVAETPAPVENGFVPCAAIISWADLRLGEEIQGVLEQHDEAGAGRFRGIRSRATWHEHPMVHPVGEGQAGLLLDKTVQRAVRRLGALGLTLDIWAFHTQLGDVAQLAAASPDTVLVLDHCGGPLGIGPYASRRREVFNTWRHEIARLAEFPNVVVKLGGLGMPRTGFGFHQADMPPTSAQLAHAWTPYVETCIEHFGANRCMFESNFPVDKGACSYTVLWNAFKRMTAALPQEDKESLFSGTAARTYRIAFN